MRPLLLGIGLLAVSSGSFANTDNFDRFYFGLGSSFTNITGDNIDIGGIVDTTSLGLVFGYQPIKYLAIEGRQLFRVSQDNALYDAQGSLLARGIVPIHEYFNFYAVAGVSLIELDNFDQHDSDFTYGVGMRFKNQSPLILDIEYSQVYDGTFNGIDMTLRSVNLNILYGF